MYYNYYPEYGTDYNREAYYSKSSMPKSNVLKLEGTGSVKASPDTAVIFLGVISENIKLSEAQQENSEIANRVISALLKLGISEKDIQTANYSVDPQYDFVEGKQIFRNYRVTNNIRVTVKDVENIGKIIDTAIESGANVVYNVNFALSNRDLYYRKALSLAIINAIEKAKSIERTLNIEVNTIPVEIAEESSDNIQPRELYAIKAPASPTPIMTGEIEISAKVNVVFKYVER